MNGMGDILYDPPSLLRRIGPMIVSEDLGGLIARVSAVADADVDAVLARHAEHVRARPDAARARAARVRGTPRGGDPRDAATRGDYAGFSFHFDSIGGDGRFEQLPLLAASDLMADGYGYAAEGDTNTTSLMCAAQTMIGDAHFSEMYAMDWELDSVLISHMGEGNWKIARRDRPIRLIDRELGIGRLSNPPTPVFSAEPGVATTAALVPLEGEYYRLVVGRGQVLDTPELPNVEMHYFHFRPDSGMEAFMDEWLAARRPAPLRAEPRRSRRPLAPAGGAAGPRVRGDLSWRLPRSCASRYSRPTSRCPRHGLVTLTWGNASGIDRERGAGGDQAERGAVRGADRRATSWSSTSTATWSQASGARRPTRRRTWPCTARSRTIGGIVHTHSTWATAWAQAQREIPVLGTTHADLCAAPDPAHPPADRRRRSTATTRRATGDVLVRGGRRARARGAAVRARARTRAVLLGRRTPADAVEIAVTLEEVARMALLTTVLDPDVAPLAQALRDKHHRAQARTAGVLRPAVSAPAAEDV